MASIMASTLDLSRPSEKFGTHSTKVDIGEKNIGATRKAATLRTGRRWVGARKTLKGSLGSPGPPGQGTKFLARQLRRQDDVALRHPFELPGRITLMSPHAPKMRRSRRSYKTRENGLRFFCPAEDTVIN